MGIARPAGGVTKEPIHHKINKKERKDLKVLADDFCLLHKTEVQEIIENCKSYEEGRHGIMKVYEELYL